MIKLTSFKMNELVAYTWFAKIEDSILIYTNGHILVHVPLKYVLSEEPKLKVNGCISLYDWDLYKLNSVKELRLSEKGDGLDFKIKGMPLSIPILTEDQARDRGLEKYPGWKSVMPETHTRPASFMHAFNGEFLHVVQCALGGAMNTHIEFFGMERAFKVINDEDAQLYGVIYPFHKKLLAAKEEAIQTEIEAQKALL